MTLPFPRGLWRPGATWAAARIAVTTGGRYARSGATAPLLGLFATITRGEAIPINAAATVFLHRREYSHA